MDLLFEVLIYTIFIIIICPFAGGVINFIVKTILGFILGIIDRTGKLLYVLVNVVTFPGVIHHELAHAIVAFVTGAKIKEIKLYRMSEGTLGSVKYVPRGPILLKSIQICLSSAAPVIFGAATSGILLYFLVSNVYSLPVMLLLVYFLVSVVLHMDMSAQDIIVYFKGIPCTAVLIYLIVLIGCYGFGV